MSGETIAITGAAGSIGRVLRAGLAKPGRTLRLLDIAPLGPANPGEDVLQVDGTDAVAMRDALAGVDVLIHLAVNIEEGPWETLFPLNYELTRNAYEGARLGGARRIIFPSSVQAVGFHPVAKRIGPAARIRPSGFYGVYKAWGEALSSLYVDRYGLSAICLRIASFHEHPVDRRMLKTWLSHGDAVRLFEAAIMAEADFLTVYGISANSAAMIDDPNWARLGYSPQDNAETYRAEIEQAGDDLTEIGFRTHGGDYASVDYTAAGFSFEDRD